MRLHCERNVVESIRKGWSSSKEALVQGSRIIKMIKIWPSFGKVTSTVHRKMYMGLPYIYPVRIDITIYQIYQLVGGFPAKFVYHHVLVKTYSFTWLLIRASISFLRRGRFQNWSLPLINMVTCRTVVYFDWTTGFKTLCANKTILFDMLLQWISLFIDNDNIESISILLLLLGENTITCAQHWQEVIGESKIIASHFTVIIFFNNYVVFSFYVIRVLVEITLLVTPWRTCNAFSCSFPASVLL